MAGILVLDAAKNAPDEVKLRREMSFQKVVEELSEAVGRFFAIGYGLADGVEIVKSLKLNLTESEIKNILIQAQLRYENDIT
jgi:predicted nuclease with TOPRIM domain